MMPTRLPTGEMVYDPRGTVTVEPAHRAPRQTTLEHLRLGVLDNSKWNAGRLLRAVVAKLEARHRLGAVTQYKKESFSSVASDALVAQICDEADVVLTAIGD